MWLKNKMAEKDTLDAVNAEVCYNVLIDLKKRKDILGAMYYQTKLSLNRERKEKQYITVDIELPEGWEE